jgi:hypothetical protein
MIFFAKTVQNCSPRAPDLPKTLGFLILFVKNCLPNIRMEFGAMDKSEASFRTRAKTRTLPEIVQSHRNYVNANGYWFGFPFTFALAAEHAKIDESAYDYP